MRSRKPLKATFVLLFAAPSLLLATPAGAVTVAWDTIIDDGNYFQAMDTFDGHTFVLLGWGLTCRVARLDAAGTQEWIRDVGHATDSMRCDAIEADAGGVYVAMSAIGSLDGMDHDRGWDTYVRRLTLDGDDVWIRAYATNESEIAESIATTGAGVYVVGWTISADFPRTEDAYVRHWDADGNAQWTHFLRTDGWDIFYSVAADATGAYVGWQDFSGTESAIRHYEPDGSIAWTTPVPAENSVAYDLALSGGTLFAAGSTQGAFPGKQNLGGYDAFLASLDPVSGTFGWVREFGSDGGEEAYVVSAGPLGVYVAGYTYGSLPRFENRGNADAFVRAYGFDGKRRWTRQFGTHRYDSAEGVGADATGVIVGGNTTGNLGDAHVDGIAAFVRRWEPA
jgi:hypothetical protein